MASCHCVPFYGLGSGAKDFVILVAVIIKDELNIFDGQSYAHDFRKSSANCDDILRGQINPTRSLQ